MSIVPLGSGSGGCGFLVELQGDGLGVHQLVQRAIGESKSADLERRWQTASIRFLFGWADRVAGKRGTRCARSSSSARQRWVAAVWHPSGTSWRTRRSLSRRRPLTRAVSKASTFVLATGSLSSHAVAPRAGRSAGAAAPAPRERAVPPASSMAATSSCLTRPNSPARLSAALTAWRPRLRTSSSTRCHCIRRRWVPAAAAARG